jgi:hypothetical protein
MRHFHRKILPYHSTIAWRLVTMEVVLRTSCQAANAGHSDLLQRYKARSDQLIQLRQKGLNFVLNVNDLNNHGKVARRLEIEFGIHPATMAVTQRPVESGRTGETSLQGGFNNGTIKNTPGGSIGLADERTKKNSVSKRFHVPLSKETAEILQYLEQELIAGGVDREAIKTERKDGEQMFVGEAIVIIGYLIDWGSKAATLIQAINWAHERWGKSISLTNGIGEKVRIGGEGGVSAAEGASR